MTTAARDVILKRLEMDLKSMHLIEVVAPVFDRVHDLLARHPLRASDAIHLASALLIAQRSPRELEFVAYDARLAEAARAEHLAVLPR
jgi:uncharacterized protein